MRGDDCGSKIQTHGQGQGRGVGLWGLGGVGGGRLQRQGQVCVSHHLLLLLLLGFLT